jgi:hypothetical protein
MNYLLSRGSVGDFGLRGVMEACAGFGGSVSMNGRAFIVSLTPKMLTS